MLCFVEPGARNVFVRPVSVDGFIRWRVVSLTQVRQKDPATIWH